MGVYTGKASFSCYRGNISKTVRTGDFPRGPEAKIPCYHCRGPGFNPWPENLIPHVSTKDHVWQLKEKKKKKDPACCKEDWRSCVPQPRPHTNKYISIQKKQTNNCKNCLLWSQATLSSLLDPAFTSQGAWANRFIPLHLCSRSPATLPVATVPASNKLIHEEDLAQSMTYTKGSVGCSYQLSCYHRQTSFSPVAFWAVMPGSCHRVALLSLASVLSWVTVKASFLKMPDWARMKDTQKKMKKSGYYSQKWRICSHQKWRNCFIHLSLLALTTMFPRLAGPQASEKAEGAGKTRWSSRPPPNTHTPWWGVRSLAWKESEGKGWPKGWLKRATERHCRRADSQTFLLLFSF